MIRWILLVSRRELLTLPLSCRICRLVAFPQAWGGVDFPTRDLSPSLSLCVCASLGCVCLMLSRSFLLFSHSSAIATLRCQSRPTHYRRSMYIRPHLSFTSESSRATSNPHVLSRRESEGGRGYKQGSRWRNDEWDLAWIGTGTFAKPSSLVTPNPIKNTHSSIPSPPFSVPDEGLQAEKTQRARSSAFTPEKQSVSAREYPRKFVHMRTFVTYVCETFIHRHTQCT